MGGVFVEKFLANAQWIWCNHAPQNDEYGEFVDHFTYRSGQVFL